MQDNNTVIRTMMFDLLKGTYNYVYPRIHVVKHQKAYKMAADLAISILSDNDSQYNSIFNIKKELGGLRERQYGYFPTNIFNKRKEEIEYYNLALDHALDVVFCLEARFITGGYDAEPRNYRGKFIHMYNDIRVF